MFVVLILGFAAAFHQTAMAIVCYNTEAAINTGRSRFVACFEEGIEAYCYSKTTSNGSLTSGCVSPLQVNATFQNLLNAYPEIRLQIGPQTSLAMQCRSLVREQGSGACTAANGTTTCCCVDGKACGAERFRLHPHVRCQVNELIEGDVPSSDWCLGSYCYRYNRQMGCFPTEAKHRQYWMDRFQIPADHFKCPDRGGGCYKLPGAAGVFCCCQDSDGCDAMHKDFLKKNPPQLE